MKREKDLNILDELSEQLEEILNKAKANDLCHLIESIKETILKVKELNRERKVECEHTGERNSGTCNFQMACACNDWGPDKLGPDGKWMCEMCGENCLCDETWDSRINITENKFSKEAGPGIKKKRDTSEKNQNQPFQKNVSVKHGLCRCGSSKKIENDDGKHKKILVSCSPEEIEFIENRGVDKKMKKPFTKDISVLYDPRFISSTKKVESVEAENKILKLQDSVKDEPQSRLSCKEQKCKNCKCTHDERGNKIKTEECRAASERRKKLIANQQKEKNAIKCQDFENQKVDDELKEFLKTEVSQSTNNLILPREDTLVFSKKGKCDIVECKSSFMEFLRLWKNSKDQRCWEGIKESCSEFPDERKRMHYEKPEKPLKCSEMTRLEKSTRPNENMESKEQSCNMTENFEKSPKHLEIPKRKADKKFDELPIKKTVKGTMRRQRLQTEKLQCSSDGQKDIFQQTERRIVDSNFQNKNMNSGTSIEKLCPCGCGYFIEGVPETRSCSCNNTSKNTRREVSTSKKTLFQSQKCDCEGLCEWCIEV